MTESEMAELFILHELGASRWNGQIDFRGNSYDGKAAQDRYFELVSKFLSPYSLASDITDADFTDV